jgi:hypothetical protein
MKKRTNFKTLKQLPSQIQKKTYWLLELKNNSSNNQKAVSKK